MTSFDPLERITIDQALEHPYMAQLHFPDDEPVTECVSAYDFDFEIFSLKKEDYKDLIYDEIMLYHDKKQAAASEKAKNDFPGGVLMERYGKERIRKKYRK
jgi:hypothetical protein